MEPDFLSQCDEPLSDEERCEWWNTRAVEAKRDGATWCRFSHHPKVDFLILFEGWRVRPDDEGTPRFQFTTHAP